MLSDGYSSMTFDPIKTLAGRIGQVLTVAAMEGGNIGTIDRIPPCQIEDFDIGECSRIAVRVDLQSALRIDDIHVGLTIDPKTVGFMNGAVALNATEQEANTGRRPSAAGDNAVRSQRVVPIIGPRPLSVFAGWP